MKFKYRILAFLTAFIFFISFINTEIVFAKNNYIKTGYAEDYGGGCAVAGGFRYTYYSTTDKLVIDGYGKFTSHFVYIYCKTYTKPIEYIYSAGVAPNDSADKTLIDSEIRSIKTLEIHEGTTVICSNPFDYLDSLEEVTLPRTLKRILPYTFSSESKVKVINFGGTKEEWEAIKIDRCNDGLKNIKINYNVDVPDSTCPEIKPFKDNAEDTEIIKYDSNANATISATLNYYTGVLTIWGKGKIPDVSYNHIVCIEDLFLISDYDQVVYPYVETVNICEGITGIGEWTFKSSSASVISLPKSLKSISKYAFDRDLNEETEIYKLTKVIYNGSAADWDKIKISKEDNDNLLSARLIFTEKATAKDITASLSTTYYNYDGKSHTPAVTVKNTAGKTLVRNKDYKLTYSSDRKSVGKYSVKITLIGNYTGSKTLNFYIRPKPTTITKVSSGKKSFTVWWKKQTSKTDGYQIQFSTASNMKNAKSITVAKNSNYAKKITGRLQNKKYYVRVRTYKNVKYNSNTIKVYSSWSKVKSVTTR